MTRRRLLLLLAVAAVLPGCALVSKDDLDAALAQNEAQQAEIAKIKAALDTSKGHAERLAKWLEARDRLDAEEDRMVNDLLAALRRGRP